MDIQKLPIKQLLPAGYNPRKDLKSGDPAYKDLKRSIAEFGYVEPIIWNKQTNHIVGGHQRLKVLAELGDKDVECVVVDLPEDREKLLNIALNKIQGEWDNAKLADLLEELESKFDDITITGFSLQEIDEVISSERSPEAKQDEFDVDKALEEIKEPVTQPGDVWQLGQHLLACADCTDPVNYERLLSGVKAQLCVTSPPYGVGKEYEEKGIEPWFQTIEPAIRNVCRHARIVCWNLGDLFATGSQFIVPTMVFSVNMFEENNYQPIWIRIWKKQGMNFGIAPYHLVSNKPVQQYEYVSAFSRTGEEEVNDQEYMWLSAFAAHNHKFVKRLTAEERRKWGYAGIWEMNTVVANKEHPAMFPVELPWRCIKMHSDRGGIILEPFSGSGTTIIAAEQLERRCYAMEISQVYCDIAVRRWEEFTGRKAEKA